MTGGTVDALGPVPLGRLKTARLAESLHVQLTSVETALVNHDYGRALMVLRVAMRHELFGHVAVDPRELREHLPAPEWTHGDTGGIPEPDTD